MKNGYMFFLSLGKVALFARITLLVLVCAFAYLDISNFFIKLALSIAIVIAIAFSVIKAPADKDVMRQIDFFRQRFKERIKEIGHTYSMKNVKVIEAYRVKGNMHMRRTVGRDIIYPYLMSVAISPVQKGSVMVYTDELCLLKKGDPVFRESLVNISDLNVSTKYDDDDQDVVYMGLTLPGYEERVELIITNDFHYREFMEIIGSDVK